MFPRLHAFCEILEKLSLQTLLVTSDFVKQPSFVTISLFSHRRTHQFITRIRNLASPSSGRWRSSQWWQTIYDPWYHWLHSWDCQSALSGPPAANFSTDPSNLSWSGMGSEPRKEQIKAASLGILKPQVLYSISARLWPIAAAPLNIKSVHRCCSCDFHLWQTFGRI